ncbi:iron ABC transporter ATP-binding protein [Listeria newyorkensis]|uniref:Iron ABC transporter ATP-binding protein n=1 Tax=Listeria newyorkensis TaxID=1497681 RepID=A0ABX4XS87_9LIST|nr:MULTISPECIES: ATP-binding cassette domain-containing protein [Listeria]KGL39224.1 iron ABC transporter ATP-binding protein [Listeriaceae bacterium FSL A5-0209]KGL43806.1 iron ABC transporter ATP-binding protein [Listeria newyorkensis]PNP95057.1 iron ABC transporter ATP-binding protein [Listeria newyorkensis]RQW66444.1 ATP-binding cassette domain-containing protein [Listeria sp. SHR_NRA_18]WAO21990.1 ATP-binding cassette domain-containing protein [Listeria newyorkensis]
MIEVRNLGKKYGTKNVLQAVDLVIPEKQIVSFIGANGAGKSTLLSIIARLMKADSGEVLVDGVALGDWKSDDLAKRLSILKQSNHVTMRLTVRDLVAFGRFPHSKGRLQKDDEAFIEMALDYMELRDLASRYLDELSGGQQQRAYIAMIIAQNTDYILLDEPLNNLDMKHSVQIMQLLRRLVDELGKTVLLVLHDINFASCYSDSIVALKNGAVVANGSTAEMIQEDVLAQVFDMHIPISLINNDRIGVYFK